MTTLAPFRPVSYFNNTVSTYKVCDIQFITHTSIKGSIYYSHLPLILAVVFETRKKGENCLEVITKSRC